MIGFTRSEIFFFEFSISFRNLFLFYENRQPLDSRLVMVS
ncbi:hypothetical protein LEP1GSC005_2482 [Leptospira santarosai str. ST188]|nr:hypothetical protein LEP1GSC068_1557 [Leptospira sp. Fiocruz LV3954]EMF89623.1 hypothetical protein LEP1GSC005_2482 [Leptospira santarosai str. ST188]EMI66685.1 hypothetical protein LEP1GSC076_1558 [Leptospira sp. Fiocruz LV4135]EMO70198.1 hypothetical protein LEP1GSC130_3118 [Leptospira santarosai str. 200403458]EMO96780.1 hypothetical protein LEP1GSC120_3878 [Leptospira santarosai str. 200702252]